MTGSTRVGKCNKCSNTIYKGGNSKKFLGHKNNCENYGTDKIT